MKYLLASLFFFSSVAAFAQQKEGALVQFSGVVHNADSLDVVVPYVTITNQNSSKQVNIANYMGYFSFVAHERDTLLFSCVGYAPQTIIIPEHLNKSYTLKVALKPQTTNLPSVRVFPWATTDEFKKDFISMKLADDDLEIARKNLSKGSLAEMMKTLPRDAHEIQSAYAQGEHLNILNQHSLMPNPLLNPIAWGTLIKQIADGDKSRSSGGN
ncbi:peptidase associated/transthyretin-like domain-containing protein [Mucilaginibacter boryungensis]|uniref:Carboxypeptidase-like protein n=1 Tax=Mucilaginibacter boryungensis TaxID=768480 RepID=A0ABR9XN88_9SPHI|nr:hypothetical protein [Mucilaginibacter boryungensis]MBE9668574.1 hypothetical protein [Mucilaginibacter boryungensis]